MPYKRSVRELFMRISVVIPTLNEGRYLENTLFHVSQQKPYEIIVADSRSTDATRTIARLYKARIIDAPRGSASFGRNAGGYAARGDIILFLDADTIAFPTLIETIKNDFANHADMVGWTCVVNAFSHRWRDHTEYNIFNALTEFLITHAKKPHAAGVAIAVKKHTFETVGGFDERLAVVEDHDFALRLARHGTFHFSKDTCVFTSTRRLEQWGIAGFFKRYSKNYLEYVLNKDALKKKNVVYRPVR